MSRNINGGQPSTLHPSPHFQKTVQAPMTEKTVATWKRQNKGKLATEEALE